MKDTNSHPTLHHQPNKKRPTYVRDVTSTENQIVNNLSSSTQPTDKPDNPDNPDRRTQQENHELAPFPTPQKKRTAPRNQTTPTLPNPPLPVNNTQILPLLSSASASPFISPEQTQTQTKRKRKKQKNKKGIPTFKKTLNLTPSAPLRSSARTKG